MTCSIPHSDNEIQALVQKQIDEDMVHQKRENSDEEALRETLEEQEMDEKAREDKIRQKQADDDEYFMEFGVMRIDSDYESSD
ncbi:hypothetical protein Tco_0496017 [Tanacetum coccineum]